MKAYTEAEALELMQQICVEIASSSKSIQTICSEEGMPGKNTVFTWIKNYQECRKMYDLAKEEQADYLAEELLNIADDGSNDFMENKDGYNIENKEWVNRSRLRVDTRKWIMSKLKPKKYGDKIEHGGSINLTNEPIKFE